MKVFFWFTVKYRATSMTGIEYRKYRKILYSVLVDPDYYVLVIGPNYYALVIVVSNTVVSCYYVLAERILVIVVSNTVVSCYYVLAVRIRLAV